MWSTTGSLSGGWSLSVQRDEKLAPVIRRPHPLCTRSCTSPALISFALNSVLTFHHWFTSTRKASSGKAAAKLAKLTLRLNAPNSCQDFAWSLALEAWGRMCAFTHCESASVMSCRWWFGCKTQVLSQLSKSPASCGRLAMLQGSTRHSF